MTSFSLSKKDEKTGLDWTSKHYYSMCSPSTESQPMSLLTVVSNLYPTSFIPLVKSSICAYTSPLGTTQKEMARLSAPIRPLNSTCMSTPIINKTTGPSYSHWQSSHITMLLVLLPEFHCSSPTKDITSTFQSSQNVI